MEKYYEGLTSRWLSELETISDQMSHPGEKGRNNELVLKEFLERALAKRYNVSTGKVLAAGGQESVQIDLIVHDRLNTPELVEARAWRLVPVESVYAVIAVKTTLDRGELEDALKCVKSVRSLPRTAGITYGFGEPRVVPESHMLRPRGFVFAFKSTWSTLAGADKAFREVLEPFDDSYRPNAVCLLDQGFIVRQPFTQNTNLFSTYALMHFFVFLSQCLDTFPKYHVDLSRYFTESYERSGH